jgi:hypothetical protein
VETRESGTVYGGGRRSGLLRIRLPRPATTPSSQLPLAQRPWLLPGALGVLVVGLVAGTVLATFGLPFGSGPTPAPAHPAETPLPGLVGGSSPLPAHPSSSASPGGPSASPNQVVPPLGVLRTASGQCLDVEKRDNDAWTLTAGCNSDSDQQRWQLKRASNDQYVIGNLSTDGCLDVEDASRDDGARILQRTCHDADNQRWLVRWEPAGFTLANVNSGMCATVEGDGKLRQRTCGVDTNQRWLAQPSGQSPISSSAT